MSLLREFELEQIANISRPRMRAGDIVRVGTKVQEGDKTRVQTFEGTVMGIRGSGPSATFTVRRETGKYGVERIFPLYSPLITGIDIIKRQKVRRSKLNFMRQAGQRRVKEDAMSMQRHVKEESDKQRLADQAAKASAKEAEAKKRGEEKAAQEEKARQATEKKAEAPASGAKTEDNKPADQA